MGAPVRYLDHTLDNGLRLLICEDHLAPVAATVLAYGVGVRHERPGEFELSHLFEHLMFEGTAHSGRHEHFALVAEAGGYLNAMTDSDCTVYFHAVPSASLELPLWLEADRLANLTITQQGLDNQREVVRNEHRQRRENTPYGSAVDDLLERLFPPGYPYRMSMAAHAELADVTLGGVRRFFRTHYAPNNAVLAVLGDVEPERVCALAERYLGAVARRDVPAPADSTLPAPTGEQRETLPTDASLPRVYFAWRAPVDATPDFDAAELLSAVLGVGRASRLHRRLVQELELATDVSARLYGFAGGPSLMMASATARSGADVDDLEQAFRDVLAELATTPVAEHELARARAQRERETLGLLDRLLTRGLLLASAAVVHGDPERINTRLAGLGRVRPRDLQGVAAATFDPAGQVVLRYLPRLP